MRRVPEPPPSAVFDRQARLRLGAGLALASAGACAWPGVAADRRLEQLRRSVRGPVLAPPNSAYGRARLIYQHRFDDVFPLAVVRPLSASDVSAVVGWARKTNLPLAIGSGGYLARFGRV